MPHVTIEPTGEHASRSAAEPFPGRDALAAEGYRFYAAEAGEFAAATAGACAAALLTTLPPWPSNGAAANPPPAL
jgi:hypothetical protein